MFFVFNLVSSSQADRVLGLLDEANAIRIAIRRFLAVALTRT